jgi:hypothetical protein
MQTPSELPVAAQNVPSAGFSPTQPVAEELGLEDEEFPADLPTSYDWLLQPASQRASRRLFSLAAAILVALLMAVSGFFVHNLSRTLPSVLASPSTSSPSK